MWSKSRQYRARRTEEERARWSEKDGDGHGRREGARAASRQRAPLCVSDSSALAAAAESRSQPANCQSVRPHCVSAPFVGKPRESRFSFPLCVVRLAASDTAGGERFGWVQDFLDANRMSRTMNEKEELVKKSLFSFVRKQVPTAQLSLIDDIVLGYVVSMVEESALEDELDVDGVTEMVSACLPEFSTIEKEAVTEWLLDIESQLRQGKKGSNDSSQQNDPLSCISLAALLPPEPQRTTRVHHLSETSDAGSDSSGEYYADESSWDQVALLQEMFPAASPAEARHCLAVAGGDIARAAQLALHRQEAGQSIVSNHTFLTPNGRSKAPRVNDEELKARIINRYSYVDRDDDSREHRPVAPKTEPKKLVRYLDNKIVSVKGERFTEVKRGGEDEDGNESGRKPRGHCRP